MKSKLLGSESHHTLETACEMDTLSISQSRSTPTILPSLPSAQDFSNIDEKSNDNRKESTSHFVERIRANSTNGGSDSSSAPLDSSPMKLEFRKSRSLVRKIQERTANKEAALRLDPPKETNIEGTPAAGNMASVMARLPPTSSTTTNTVSSSGMITPRGNESIVSTNTLAGTPTHGSTLNSPLVAVAPKSGSKLHASPHPKPVRQRQIPSLTLDRVSNTTGNTANNNSAQDHYNNIMTPTEPSGNTPVFQHYSFPKSLSTTSTPISSSTSNSSVLTGISSPHVFPSQQTNNTSSISNNNSSNLASNNAQASNHLKTPTITASSSDSTRNRLGNKLPFPSEFIVIENTQLHSQSSSQQSSMQTSNNPFSHSSAAPKNDIERAVANDRILQQRLQQAKALNRKDDSNGAVMFKFALWGNKKRNDHSSATTNDVDMAVAQPKSASKLRGPKIARENQRHDGDQEEEEIVNRNSRVNSTENNSRGEGDDVEGDMSENHRPIKKNTTDVVVSTSSHTPSSRRQTVVIASSHVSMPSTPSRVLRSQSVPTTPAIAPPVMQPQSTIKIAGNNFGHTYTEEDSYSDEEFERLPDEEELKHGQEQGYPSQPVQQTSTQSTATIAATAAAAGRNLAMTLRTLVVEAKSLGSEYSSPAQSAPNSDSTHYYLSPQPSMTLNNGSNNIDPAKNSDTASGSNHIPQGQEEIFEEDVENSYSSFALPKKIKQIKGDEDDPLRNIQSSLTGDAAISMLDSTVPMVDEDINSDWDDDHEIHDTNHNHSNDQPNERKSERRRSLRRSFSAEQLDGSGGANHTQEQPATSSMHSVMSKSGPATFLSSMQSIKMSDSFIKQQRQQEQEKQDVRSIEIDDEVIYDETLLHNDDNNQSRTLSNSRSIVRNKRANSCGIHEFRQHVSNSSLLHHQDADGSAEDASGDGGPLLTSLTSRNEKQDVSSSVSLVAAPTVIMQSQTPELYRYSSRPEASSHHKTPSSNSNGHNDSNSVSRYRSMRQQRQESLLSQKKGLPATNTHHRSDPLNASKEVYVTPTKQTSAAGASTSSSVSPTDDTQQSQSQSQTQSQYNSSPDNQSVSVGNVDHIVPIQDIPVYGGQQLLSARDDSVTSSNYQTPRLTELSDDDIVNVNNNNNNGNNVNVFKTTVAVTHMNPTGNPFHRFAEPVNQPRILPHPHIAPDHASFPPPLSSQPQPVISIDEFLANINKANKVVSSETGHNSSNTIHSKEPHNHDSPPSAKHNSSEVTDKAIATIGNSANSDIPGVVHPNSDLQPLVVDDIAPDKATTSTSPLKWIKGEVIGEGTFGKVYKGLNQSTGELLAIKQFYLADGSEEEVDELQREIAVMWELDHENIVRYLGTSKTDRFLYIILEYVTGGSIATMLAHYGAFTESLIRRFSCQILQGVAYLHSRGIVHRDIKGANILVTDTGIAKLADFGCSKRLAGLCTTSLEESMHMMRGSVPWMAPEVIKQAGYGRSSDIWSFGATVIEMATGKPPWSEYCNNLATLFHVATSNQPPATPTHLSPECQRFVQACLLIDPDKRETAAHLLAAAPFLQEERVKQQQQQQQQRVSHATHASQPIPATAMYVTTPRRRGTDRVVRPGSAALRGEGSGGGSGGVSATQQGEY